MGLFGGSERDRSEVWKGFIYANVDIVLSMKSTVWRLNKKLEIQRKPQHR